MISKKTDTSEVNRPQAAWKAYREKVYHAVEPLPQPQARDLSLAFYAGMFANFILVSQISGEAKDEESGSDELERFRQEILSASMRANLDRSDGKS